VEYRRTTFRRIVAFDPKRSTPKATLQAFRVTVNFTFVSCQDVKEGKLNAYRRMIYEDERAPADQQLDFVLHLGDLIIGIC